MHKASDILIAHVCTARTWRGGERQALFLAAGLQARGMENFIVVRPGSALAARARDEGVATVEWSGRPWNPLARRALGTLLKKRGVDLVHAHDAHAVGLVAGRFGAGARAEASRVATRRVAFPIRHPAKYATGVDFVVAVTAEIAEICRRAGVPAERVGVVNSGTRLDEAVRALPRRAEIRAELARRYGIVKDDPLLVLYAANLDRQKGHRHLLDAWPAVLSRQPRAVLLLAGEGGEEEAFKEQARALDVADEVVFAGFRKDMPELCAAADLFVMPSLSEGLTTAAVDAMAAGLPVVASAVGGLLEIVEDGRTGLLVPPADPPRLADALAALLTDDGRRAAQGAEARRRARRFSVDAMVEGNLRVYRKLRESVVEPPPANREPPI